MSYQSDKHPDLKAALIIQYHHEREMARKWAKAWKAHARRIRDFAHETYAAAEQHAAIHYVLVAAIEQRLVKPTDALPKAHYECKECGALSHFKHNIIHTDTCILSIPKRIQNGDWPPQKGEDE